MDENEKLTIFIPIFSLNIGNYGINKNFTEIDRKFQNISWNS